VTGKKKSPKTEKEKVPAGKAAPRKRRSAPEEREDESHALVPVGAPVEIEDREVELEEDHELEEEITVSPDDVLSSPPEVSGDAELTVLAVDEDEEAAGLVRYDPVRAYIHQIRRYPLLTPDEEHDVATRYVRTRDPGLARRLVTSNLRLVVKIAHEYSRVHQNLMDLVQEGNVGLIQAVEKFDPERGVKLSTYSSWWIRAYILKYLLNSWRLVKVGTTQAQRKLFFNLHKQQELLRERGVVPTPQLLAEALDVSEREVSEMQKRMAASDLSLSTPLRSDEDDGRTVMDLMSDHQGIPEEVVAADELRRLVSDKLHAYAAGLKGRDLVIMRERLLSDEPMTLKDIGDRYGISRERARQLEKRLMTQLREYLTTELGDNVVVALGFE
jgi:RNA polymerase sigma-32 factor